MAIIELLHPPLEIENENRLVTPDDVGGYSAWHVLVRDGALTPVYAHAALPPAITPIPELRAEALSYTAPEAVRSEERPLVVGSLGAAWIWLGGDPPTEIEYQYHLGKHRRESLQVNLREAPFGPDDVCQLAGIWVTNRARTIRDLALWCPREVAVPLIRQLVGKTKAELRTAALMLERPVRLVNRPAARQTLAAV